MPGGIFETQLPTQADVTIGSDATPRKGGRFRSRTLTSPLALALEPRFMFDAAGVATGGEAAVDAAAQEAADQQTDNPQAEDQNDPLADALSTTAPPADRREVVFVDPNVGNFEALVSGVHPAAEVVVLNPTGDGLQQIADYLSDVSDIDAVHIVSHGEAGAVSLGGMTLDLAAIDARSETLAQIGDALNADADILFYGCDVAAGDTGAAFVSALAEATGADIAASTDDTGDANQGGNWVLESKTGDIEAEIAVNDATRAEYDGLLQEVPENENNDFRSQAQQIPNSAFDFDHASEDGNQHKELPTAKITSGFLRGGGSENDRSDYFEVQLIKGQTLYADIDGGKGGEWFEDVDTTLAVFGSFGGSLAFNNTMDGPADGGSSSDKDANLVFVAPATGTYYVRVSNVSSFDRGTYTLYLSKTIPETKSTEVTTGEDVVDAFDGKTSLREAIDYAVSLSSPGDRVDVTFADDVTQVQLDNKNFHEHDGDFENPDVDISGGNIRIFGGDSDDKVTIIGDSSGQWVGFGKWGGFDRVFDVKGDAEVVFENLIIKGGKTDDGGGGIQVRNHAEVTVSNTTVEKNEAGYGGGIYSAATPWGSAVGLTVENSTVQDNYAGYGGGIKVDDSKAWIERSTIEGNESTSGSGGGVKVTDGGKVWITDSTVSNNSSGNDGGGIFSYRSDLYLLNSTVSGNDALDNGGGIAFEGKGGDDLRLTHVTIANNLGDSNKNSSRTEGGGLYMKDTGSGDPDVRIKYTIISENYRDSRNGPSDNIKNDEVGYDAFEDNLVVEDAGLDVLDDNGGPTKTHALLVGSQALNRAFGSDLDVDQRGETRPGDADMGGGRETRSAAEGPQRDIGAFEAQAPVAEADELATHEDVPLTFTAEDLLANDTDADLFDQPVIETIPAETEKGGTISYNEADGTYTYTPKADFSGVDSFVYTIVDEAGLTAQAKVTISVKPEVDATVDVAFEFDAITKEVDGKVYGGDVIKGTVDQDDLVGTADGDTIIGLGDDDTIQGLGDDDLLIGDSFAGEYSGTLKVSVDSVDKGEVLTKLVIKDVPAGVDVEFDGQLLTPDVGSGPDKFSYDVSELLKNGGETIPFGSYDFKLVVPDGVAATFSAGAIVVSATVVDVLDCPPDSGGNGGGDDNGREPGSEPQVTVNGRDGGEPSPELADLEVELSASIAYSAFDLYEGTDGDDTIYGNGGDDKILGNDGDDTLIGDQAKPGTGTIELVQGQDGVYDISGFETVELTIDVEDFDAGFNSSFGWYVAGADGNPIEGAIIDAFLDPSTDPDGPVRTITIVVGDLPAGATSLGFFLIPDGGELNDGLTDGAAVGFTPGDSDDPIAVTLDGTPLDGAGASVLFSDPTLNPGGLDHEVSNEQPGNSNWEDQAGGGDLDFNDLNLTLTVKGLNPDPSVGGDDIIMGGAGDDTIFGNGGNDALSGDGDDPALKLVANPGFGNDTIFGGFGDDYIEGNAGDDILLGGVGKDFIQGNGGDDAISGGFGDDVLFGDNFGGLLLLWQDHLAEGGEAEALLAGAEDADDAGETAYDYGHAACWFAIDGTPGDDVIFGNSGDDIIFGQRGDDTIFGDTPETTGENLIENGSFEEFGDAAASGGRFEVFFGIPGWVAGGVAPFELQESGAGGVGAVDGEVLLELDSDTFGGQFDETNASVTQVIDGLIPGASYALVINVASRTGNESSGFEVNLGGETLIRSLDGQSFQVWDGSEWSELQDLPQGEFVEISVSFTADAPAALLELNALGTADEFGALFDDLSLNIQVLGSTAGPAGNDIIFGGRGHDYIEGNGRADLILGGRGNDYIFGNGGNDILLGNAGNDVIQGNAGDDQISGGVGNDWLFGDTVGWLYSGRWTGENVSSQMDMPADAEGLASFAEEGAPGFGSGGNDVIFGNAGDDVIFGQGGNDVIFGDTPEDAGENLIENGSFEDFGDAAASGGNFEVFFEIPGWVAGGDAPFELQKSGAGGVDAVDGAVLLELDSDTFGGQFPDDTNASVTQQIGGLIPGLTYTLVVNVASRTGSESSGFEVKLDGETLIRSLDGENFQVWNGSEWSELQALPDGEFTEIRVSYTAEDSGALLELNALGSADELGALFDDLSLNIRVLGSTEGDAGKDIIFGGTGDDYVEGNGENDWIFGGIGDDRLRGNQGDDVIFGGFGEDNIRGNAGNDALFGGFGDDNIRGNGGIDFIAGNSGDDRLRGGGGSDFIQGNGGDDTINGGRGDDVLFGDNAPRLFGQWLWSVYDANSDGGQNGGQLSAFAYDGEGSGAFFDNGYEGFWSGYNGEPGNDVIDGDEGDDRIFGQGGNDTVDGGSGFDRVSGGTGNDTGVLVLDQNDLDFLTTVSVEEAADALFDWYDGNLDVDTLQIVVDPALLTVDRVRALIALKQFIGENTDPATDNGDIFGDAPLDDGTPTDAASENLDLRAQDWEDIVLVDPDGDPINLRPLIDGPDSFDYVELGGEDGSGGIERNWSLIVGEGEEAGSFEVLDFEDAIDGVLVELTTNIAGDLLRIDPDFDASGFTVDVLDDGQTLSITSVDGEPLTAAQVTAILNAIEFSTNSSQNSTDADRTLVITLLDEGAEPPADNVAVSSLFEDLYEGPGDGDDDDDDVGEEPDTFDFSHTMIIGVTGQNDEPFIVDLPPGNTFTVTGSGSTVTLLGFSIDDFDADGSTAVELTATAGILQVTSLPAGFSVDGNGTDSLTVTAPSQDALNAFIAGGGIEFVVSGISVAQTVEITVTANDLGDQDHAERRSVPLTLFVEIGDVVNQLPGSNDPNTQPGTTPDPQGTQTFTLLENTGGAEDPNTNVSPDAGLIGDLPGPAAEGQIGSPVLFGIPVTELAAGLPEGTDLSQFAALPELLASLAPAAGDAEVPVEEVDLLFYGFPINDLVLYLVDAFELSTIDSREGVLNLVAAATEGGTVGERVDILLMLERLGLFADGSIDLAELQGDIGLFGLTLGEMVEALDGVVLDDITSLGELQTALGLPATVELFDPAEATPTSVAALGTGAPAFTAQIASVFDAFDRDAAVLGSALAQVTPTAPVGA